MNLHCIFLFAYMVTSKMQMQEAGINALDLCLFRTFVAFIVSTAIALFLKIPFRVAKSERNTLFLRSVIGTIGFTSFLFAVKYLPLGIHMILFNTSPFQASLFGWILISETLQRKDIVCMIISFSGVLIIAFSKPIVS
jgi:drug/metabolite transporter (DMT)-like permease